MTITGLEEQFSRAPAAVRGGPRIGIHYGKVREPVAMIVPHAKVRVLARAGPSAGDHFARLWLFTNMV